MCQMSVYIDRDGEQENIMENASRLEVADDIITVSTLFEEPKEVAGVQIQSIDFQTGKVIIRQIHQAE